MHVKQTLLHPLTFLIINHKHPTSPKQVANNKGERQRLYGLRFPPSSPVAAGSRLVDKAGARAGVVTSVSQGDGRALAYIRRTVPSPVVGAELLVVDGGVAVEVVELPYATRTEAQSASGMRASKLGGGGAGGGDGEGGKGAEAAAAKAVEEERKAKKLEEMRKRLEAFQKGKQTGG